MKAIFAILILSALTFNSFGQSGNENLKLKDSRISLFNTDRSSLGNVSETKTRKQKDFTFGINVYLWAASLNGTAALPSDNPILSPQTPEVQVSLKFSDAVKYLKFVIMFAGNFRYKSIALMYDIAYVNLKYSASVPVASTYISADLSAKTFTGDVDLAYRFPSKNKNLQLGSYIGARISSLDNTLDFFRPNGEVVNAAFAKTWVDPLVGGDAKIDLSKHWLMYLKGDVGGFGISSNFTGLILWTIGYKFTENLNTTLGFKYLYVDYDKDNFLWKMSQYGMLLSFGYMFK